MDTRVREKYSKIKKIGEGGYGKVYIVQGKSSGTEMVMKEIDMSQIPEDEQKAALQEAKVMKMLKHPNIVKFYDVYKTTKKSLCIVMEYANGGDLGQLVKARKKQLKETADDSVYFQEDEIFKIFAQISDALSLMHNREQLFGKKIIHRDIKSQNIFLTADGTVKLGDFGISRILENSTKAQSIIGSPFYISPEMTKGEKYDEKTDLWSLGVLLYEMCALKYPFTGKSVQELTTAITEQKFKQIPDHYSQDLKDIIHGLLQKKPEKRANILQVLKHPKVKATLANLQLSKQQVDQSMSPEEHDKSHSDEDRSDEDTPADVEGQTGTVRQLEFDIDPLQKLSKEEFVQEIEKKCGANAGQAYLLLDVNKAICYKESQVKGKEIEELLAANGIQIDDLDFFINQVPSYIIMHNVTY